MKWAYLEGAALDWDALLQGASGPVDPYVCWTERAHGFSGSRDVLLELPRPPDPPLLEELERDYGVHVMPHHRAGPSRFVCAVATQPILLVEKVGSTAGGAVLRYEASWGIANGQRSNKSTAAALAKPVAGPENLDHVVGVIDYGCAFANVAFRDGDGSRVKHIWNQEAADPPKRGMQWKVGRFSYGLEVDADAIRTHMQAHALGGGAIDEVSCYRTANYEGVLAHVAHGTHVMHCLTGTPDPFKHRDTVSTPHEHPIVFVELPRYRRGLGIGGLLKTNVLDAVHYIASTVKPDGKAVVNLSYGTNGGPHDGTSLLERALDDALEHHRKTRAIELVIPAGNWLTEAMHAALLLNFGAEASLRFEVAPHDPSDSFVELWLPPDASVMVQLISPQGDASPWIPAGSGTRLVEGNTTVAAVICPQVVCQSDQGRMMLIALAPTDPPASLGGASNAAAPYGTWTIGLRNVGPGSVVVHGWCERDDPRFGSEAQPRQPRFLDFIEPTGTLNSIAHGCLTTVVGGCAVHAEDPAQSGAVSRYSSVGPGRGFSGRRRNGGTPAKDGPEVLATADLGFEEAGVGATGIYSGDWVRLGGTSISAAAYGRAFIEAGFTSPTRRASRGSSASPDSPRHPDDGLTLPRILAGLHSIN